MRRSLGSQAARDSADRRRTETSAAGPALEPAGGRYKKARREGFDDGTGDGKQGLMALRSAPEPSPDGSRCA